MRVVKYLRYYKLFIKKLKTEKYITTFNTFFNDDNVILNISIDTLA